MVMPFADVSRSISKMGVKMSYAQAAVSNIAQCIRAYNEAMESQKQPPQIASNGFNTDFPSDNTQDNIDESPSSVVLPVPASQVEKDQQKSGQVI